MGQVIAMFSAGAVSRAGTPAPVLSPYGTKTHEFSSSGTSGASTLTADEGDFCRIINNGPAMIWVAFGASPTAVVGSGLAVAPESTADFGPVAAGHKVAVVDDA